MRNLKMMVSRHKNNQTNRQTVPSLKIEIGQIELKIGIDIRNWIRKWRS